MTDAPDNGARRQADRAGHEPGQSPLSRPIGDHPSRVERAASLARKRYGMLTPFRLGLVAKEAGLTANPYPYGSHKSLLFEQGYGVAFWRCGHAKTAKNTKRVRNNKGTACRDCFNAHDRVYRRAKRAAERSQRHAIATEAHRAETENTGSVHEGAGRETASPKASQ